MQGVRQHSGPDRRCCLSALYVPPDINEAAEAWGANCGPCAIAAVTGKTLAEVRPALGDFRGCMNPTEVRAALEALGWHSRKAKGAERAGCAHIMFDGPWSNVVRAAYAHSHWIAYRWVGSLPALRHFDANANYYGSEEPGAWLDPFAWEREVLPLLMPKKGTGHHVNAWIEAAPAAGETA